jgi:hypothetical protein
VYLTDTDQNQKAPTYFSVEPDSMEQTHLEADSRSSGQEIPRPFVERKGSLTCSHDPNT